MLVANGLSQAGAAIVAALAVESAFTRLGSEPPPVEIVIVGLVLVAMVSVSAWLRARERVDAEGLGQSYTHDLRMELFARLTAMSPRSVGSRSQGSTVLRFIGDLGAVRRWVSLGLSRLCVAGTMGVATIVALGLVDPTLAAATGIAAVVGGFGAVAQGPKLRRASRDARRRRSRLAGRVTEVVAAVGVVQANNAVERERRRVAKHSRLTRDAMIERSRRLGRLQAVAEATGSGATATLLITALSFGIDGPSVAAGMTVVGLLVPQLRGLARVQEYRQEYRVAMDAIDRFVARPSLLTEPMQPEPLNDGPGVLELQAASLDIVRDISAVAHPGQTVAIVGPNGAGKSTLLAMIGRLIDLDSGRVMLDGSDLARVRLAESRAVIGMAGPDLPLMRGSLRRNLTYHHRDASDTEIEAVIDLCGLRQLLADLEDGFDTRIDEGGTNLSSGQRQRVLLARAVLARPRLLLLDEADANLDAATTVILDTILARHEGLALIVTHRLDRVQAADEVWHLANGRLVETGPPATVLKPGHLTARLFDYGTNSVRDLETVR
jgi:ABC-type multidrug transport system fused ATPase/permease subunit